MVGVAHRCQWFFEVLSGWQAGNAMCADPAVVAGMVEPFGEYSEPLHTIIAAGCLLLRRLLLRWC